MKQFTNILAIFVVCFVLGLTKAEEDSSYLYHNTRICARHKSYLCMAYDAKHSQIVLSGRHRLRFEIETVERVNLQLNRVYTYATDKATRKKVKSCLVRKVLDNGSFGVDLSPCDTDDNELVLAVDIPHVDFDKLTTDEFVLKEISYLDDGNTVSSPYCLSQAYKSNGLLQTVSSKKQLKNKAPVILTDCGAEDEAYSQEFKAKDFSRSSSARFVVTQAPQVKAEIGMFCLSEREDLCLGLSLTNGTTLENNRLVQFKNFTKNEAKGKHDLKLRWYHDLKNNRIATASNLDFCLEAIYGKSIGKNRAGIEQFDDVLHLGTCDISLVTKDSDETLPKSENFYTYPVTTATSSYLELRTDVPSGIEGDSTVKCVSIVKCVKHDNDHCTPYNSVPVYSTDLLSQGAHARLKDCNSQELVSQRFFYRADTEITFPPTRTPTLPPSSPPVTTTAAPTKSITSAPPTKQPTAGITVEPIAPTPPPTEESDKQTTEDKEISPSKQSPGLLLALGLVGVLCLLIILVALAYYYKNRGEFTGLPEEDENFIARV